MSARRFEKKPLLLATAVRNPERFPTFLATLKPFEGNKFDESIAQKIAQTLIRLREYSPDMAIKNIETLKKYKGNDNEMTSEEVDSSLDEMSFIFNKVSPFVRDNLGHNEDEY